SRIARQKGSSVMATSSSSMAIAMRYGAARWSTRSGCCARCRADVLRLFFALLPTAEQADALVGGIAALGMELGGGAGAAAHPHATLCFIGSIDEVRLAALRDAASRVRARPVSLRFDALEVWEKPEILCAIAGESDSARDLSAALGEAAVAAGFAPDLKP